MYLDSSLGFLIYLADAARCAGGNWNVHKSSISLTSSFSLRNLPQRLLHSFQFQNVLIFCLLANWASIMQEVLCQDANTQRCNFIYNNVHRNRHYSPGTCLVDGSLLILKVSKIKIKLSSFVVYQSWLRLANMGIHGYYWVSSQIPRLASPWVQELASLLCVVVILLHCLVIWPPPLLCLFSFALFNNCALAFVVTKSQVLYWVISEALAEL